MKTVITPYKVDIRLKRDIRCALVSDLHDRDPKETLTLLKQIRPELIFVAGDLMERHEKGESPWTIEKMDAWQGISRRRTWITKCIKSLDGSLLSSGQKGSPWKRENGYRFLREASGIAPVYLGMGNHEWYYTSEDKALMGECGVTLLDNQDCEILVGKQKLLIGGMSTRFDLEWLDSYSQKEGKKILICHHPDYYVKYIQNTHRDTFDLVLSGHTHGGQWRLFSSGYGKEEEHRKKGIPVFSPGQGIFPAFAYGKYGKLIVSSGVSNTTSIPRFGNPCEVVLLQLS